MTQQHAVPRIYSDSYLDLILAVARQHLPAVWFYPAELAWLGNKAAPITPFSKCFLDRELTVEVDLRAPHKRVLFNPDDRTRRVSVIATLAMAMPDGATILIREDMSAIFAVHTTVSEHADGVIQLFGAEPGVVLLTGEEVRAHVGKKKALIRGTSMKSFSAQHRDHAGDWVNSTVKIPMRHVKSFSVEDKV